MKVISKCSQFPYSVMSLPAVLRPHPIAVRINTKNLNPPAGFWIICLCLTQLARGPRHSGNHYFGLRSGNTLSCPSPSFRSTPTPTSEPRSMLLVWGGIAALPRCGQTLSCALMAQCIPVRSPSFSSNEVADQVITHQLVNDLPPPSVTSTLFLCLLELPNIAGNQ